MFKASTSAPCTSCAREELSRDNARQLIERLGGRSESRIRVVDRDERVLADSASTPVRKPAAPEPSYPVSGPTSRKSVLYRIGVTLWKPIQSLLDWRRRAAESPASDRTADITPQNGVRKALEGRYAGPCRKPRGSARSRSTAFLPVRAAGSGDVIGAVVVSQSTSRAIVEGYGGSVSAMNLLPHGTRIEVRLPIAQRQ